MRCSYGTIPQVLITDNSNWYPIRKSVYTNAFLNLFIATIQYAGSETYSNGMLVNGQGREWPIPNAY